MEKTNHQTNRPVMLNDGQRLMRINPDEVVYIKAERVNCQVHMLDKTTIYTLNYPLAKIEDSLPSHIFVRIHRSYIINLWHVQMVLGRYIKIDTGEHFTLGEQYRDVLTDRFNIWGEKRR